MAEYKEMRLSQLARKLNVGTSTIVEHLGGKGFEVDNKPNTKITSEQVQLLMREFQDSAMDKEEASELTIGKSHVKNVVIDSENANDPIDETAVVSDNVAEVPVTNKTEEYAETEKPKLQGIKVVGKIDLENKKAKDQEETKQEEPEEPKAEPVKEKEPVKEEVVEQKVEKEKAPVQKPKPEVKKEAVKEIKEETPKAKSEQKEKEVKPQIAPQVKKVEDKPKKEEAPVVVKKKEEKKEEVKKDNSVIKAEAESLKGLTVLGKIELPQTKKKDKPVASSDKGDANKKRKRKRVRIENRVDVNKETHKKGGQGNQGQQRHGGKGGPKRGQKRAEPEKQEISSKEIQDKIKATMARMEGQHKSSKRSKYRKEKRAAHAEASEEERMRQEEESKVLRVTEFVSANDLASLMETSVNEVISMCMGLGMFVSINQRLDAETITIIADEFGYEVQFTTAEEEQETNLLEIEDDPEDLQERAPIVTIMGHVDHGKTSLLDYIRDAKVVDSEAGGITQHIGAYSVKTDSGKKIAFLDTPGHEAFTAMRARGAKLTDIVILVVAADDRVMPQTKEAINHAQVAGVPIIIAINKVDKSTANPEKIKEELSHENILVEDWGGKYQCQHVSAKSGEGIDDLLEKILLEAEVMELQANPDRTAIGTVVEASLDKGRGYVTNILVQTGTLKIGDIIVAGAHYGRVKAMHDHKGKNLKVAGPSTPVQILGMDGAPQAGDKFVIATTDREAREVTSKRAQLLREQAVRTKKHLTLDEIGRRLAIGNFKELNLIVKGDVDGSVEALTDSLLKLSTEEVQVNIIHKAVGQITESDVLLATASDAIILGFQVRPAAGAKKLAENEEIEIRHYSVIYKAIEEMKDALEGLLEPTVEEVITANVEIREVFKISKIGTVAGCYVLDGTIKRSDNIRLIREGIVIYSGAIGALKRFKDDVSEVKFGYECGLSIQNFNDLKTGDIIEAYEEREIKRKL